MPRMIATEAWPEGVKRLRLRLDAVGLLLALIALILQASFHSGFVGHAVAQEPVASPSHCAQFHPMPEEGKGGNITPANVEMASDLGNCGAVCLVAPVLGGFMFAGRITHRTALAVPWKKQSGRTPEIRMRPPRFVIA